MIMKQKNGKYILNVIKKKKTVFRIKVCTKKKKK